MRRAWSLFPLALATACAAETVAQPPAPPVDWAALTAPKAEARAARLLDKERAVAQSYFAALASPGFTRLGPLLDELAHFEHGGGEARGRERVIAAHEAAFGSFASRRFAVERAWLTNDDKALEWTMTAVQEGKPVTLRGLTLLWTNDDALISDIHVYVATAPPSEDAPSGERRVYVEGGTPAESANVAPMRALAQTTLRESLAQPDTVVENAWGVQDFVVIEYAVSGRQLTPLPRLPLVRGRLVRLRVADVGEVHDGKVTRVWRYEQ